MELISNLICQTYNIIYNFLSFTLIVSLVVFIHEYGHYIVAKAYGVKIESFSIGLGPELFGFYDRSATRWKLSAIPLGGYVKMLGDESITGVLTNQKKTTRKVESCSLNEKQRYKKAAIAFAGPFANIVLATIAFAIFFGESGCYRTPPIIGDVIKDKPAELAGLLPGDTITKINKRRIRYFEDVARAIMLDPKTKMEIEYNRNNEKYRTSLTPLITKGRDAFGNMIEKGTIGITSVDTLKPEQLSLFEIISLSISETHYAMSLTIRALFQIFIGKRNITEIGGPIKMARYSGQSIKLGFAMVAYFIAVLSASLAAINLLPILPLDGGHLLFYAMEVILHREELISKLQKYATTFGVIILFLLVVIAMSNDIKYLLF